MNDILKEYLDVICVGLLDGVIIFSEDPSKHVEHVRSILQVLRENKLYAKVQKCEFNREQMLGPLPIGTSASLVSAPIPH